MQFCDPSERRNPQSKNQVLSDFCLGEFSGHRRWVQGENRSIGKLRSQRSEFGLTKVSRICARGHWEKEAVQGGVYKHACSFPLVLGVYWAVHEQDKIHWGLTENRCSTTATWMWLSELTHSQSGWNAGSSQVDKCRKVHWAFK